MLRTTSLTLLLALAAVVQPISTLAEEMIALNVVSAGVDHDVRTGKPLLAIKLDDASRRTFSTFSSTYVGSKTELRVDGKVIAEPVIREPITGGSLHIDVGGQTEMANSSGRASIQTGSQSGNGSLEMNSRANRKTKRPPRRGEQTLRPRPRNVANPIPIASHVVAFATDLPDWQITSDFQKSCQAPKSKIFPFAFYPNQFTDSRRPAPGLASSLREDAQATVTTKPGHRGEHEVSRKTIARGMPGRSGVTVVTMLVCFFHLHARLRARRAPGIPCALCLSGRTVLAKPRAHRAAG